MIMFMMNFDDDCCLFGEKIHYGKWSIRWRSHCCLYLKITYFFFFKREKNLSIVHKIVRFIFNCKEFHLFLFFSFIIVLFFYLDSINRLLVKNFEKGSF